MLQYGDRLVLSELDVRRWTRITGFEPTAVSTFGDLETYVRECKRYYDSPSKESAFIHRLIDMEFERHGGPAAAIHPLQLASAVGDRERDAAERKRLWNIALDGDRARRDELTRMLEAPGVQRPE